MEDANGNGKGRWARDGGRIGRRLGGKDEGKGKRERRRKRGRTATTKTVRGKDKVRLG